MPFFIARQMQENFRVKGKKLYFGFVDLEKAFDRVQREVISWTMHKLGVEEWLVCVCVCVCVTFCWLSILASQTGID